jgi:ABC-type transporter Mla subunit MlaD
MGYFFKRKLIKKLNQIIMTQEELAIQLNEIRDQADKSKNEIIQKISDLEAAVSNAGATTPAVDAALSSLKASIQALDDIVPG